MIGELLASVSVLTLTFVARDQITYTRLALQTLA